MASTRELRLLVQTSFSTGELRRLLQTWGAEAEELDGDATTLAHRLVRLGEKRFGTSEMTRRLRAEKPLLEWPEENAGSDRWAGPAPGIDVDETVVETPAVPETVLELTPPPAPTQIEQEPPQSAPPVSKTPPRSTANPMVFLEPEALRQKPARQGIDPKWVAIAGGGILAVVGLAFVAGLAWRTADAPPEPTAGAPGPTSVLGTRAAAFFDKSLLSVAQLCELDVEGAPTVEVLGVAQEACGPPKPGAARRERPELDYEPSDRREPRDPRTDPGRPEPRPDAPPRTEKKAAAGGDAAGGGGRGACTKTCMRVQDECIGACGKEPKDASLYDKYQACTSKCYTSSARCRTSCP